MTLALGSEEGVQHYELEGKGTTLFSYWMSSCSWRVRIVMKLKGIPYRYISYVDAMKDGVESYLAIYPIKNRSQLKLRD